jgi:hypothetical protein
MGGFADPAAKGEDNPEEFLVELELDQPAPAGAVWLLAAPGEAVARSAPDNGTLYEVGGYWRTGTREKPSWVTWPECLAPPPLEFTKPLDLAGLREFLRGRNLALDASTDALVAAEAATGWRFFAALPPSGAPRLAGRLTFKSVCALYPGALGAEALQGSTQPAWRLPPVELMILHSHFINVDDNTAGLKPRFGLERVYQDDGAFAGGGGLWGRPAEDRPGRLRDSAGSLAAAAALVQAVAPAGRFHLTVLAGSPRAAQRRDLDFLIYSHYPSAVETTSTGRAFLCLLAVSVVVILLGGYLLRRKGFAQ